MKLQTLLVIAVCVLAGFFLLKGRLMNTGGNTYTKISQDEAKAMMAKNDGHIIVDVRSQDEYASGHIPGAICIPNESIGSEKPAQLPAPDQIILVYCLSGGRSAQASRKLAKAGYTHVYNFGGISSWTGEVVTD